MQAGVWARKILVSKPYLPERTIAYPSLRPPDRSDLNRLPANRKLNLHRISRATRWNCAFWFALLLLSAMVPSSAKIAAQNIEFGRPATSNPVATEASSIEYWEQGNMQVLHLHGPVKICLLYTSPSPRDGLLSRMPSSA